MIASVFTPNGIVVATASFDTFYEKREVEDDVILSAISMKGLPHTYNFWNRFSLTFNGANNYMPETTIFDRFEKLCGMWETVPCITDFMPYFKKLLVDNHIQIIGILAAYDKDKDDNIAPFVYQILGESIRRVNLDNEGHINYNYIYLEKQTQIGKLLQQTRLRNGDLWEDNPAVHLRCDLFSIQKSIDLCRFMLRTSHYVENINSAMYDSPLMADVTIVTKDKVETKIMDI